MRKSVYTANAPTAEGINQHFQCVSGSYKILYIGFLVILAIILLAGGWWAGNQRAASLDTEMRERLLLKARCSK